MEPAQGNTASAAARLLRVIGFLACVLLNDIDSY